MDECIKEDAGVGAFIASGNQTWKPNCAALIQLANEIQIVTNVKKLIEILKIKKTWYTKNGTLRNIIVKSVELNTNINKLKAINIKKSLNREKTKVLRDDFKV